MTALELLNLALFNIGVTQGVAALDEQSREAYAGALLYDHMLRATLRRFPWPFATKYRGCYAEAPYPLYLAQGPFWDTDPSVLTLVQAYSNTATYVRGDVVREAGVNYYCVAATSTSGNAPPNATYWSDDPSDAPKFATGDWTYAYRWPTDCIFARRLVPAFTSAFALSQLQPATIIRSGSTLPRSGFGRVHNANPPKFRIGTDKNGLLIYAHTQEAELEYTFLDCDALFADDLFLNAFTWLLASRLAPALARLGGNNGKTALECYQMFLVAINDAATVASREQQQEPEGDASYIEARD